MSKRQKRSRRKRCRFCDELFHPNPKVGHRQYACSKPSCQRKRHAANCADLYRRQEGQRKVEQFTVRVLTRPLPAASPTVENARGRESPRVGGEPGASREDMRSTLTTYFDWEVIGDRWGPELVALLYCLLTLMSQRA